MRLLRSSLASIEAIDEADDEELLALINSDQVKLAALRSAVRRARSAERQEAMHVPILPEPEVWAGIRPS